MEGPLEGLEFAAKDVFDIAGHRTGFGQPDWLRTHPPTEVTAVVVQRLLDAGASMLGKTHTDELTYSLSGQNVHYGTPINPAAPDRIPGGSSNGSVSAVAGGLVDFALGTDCGGSIRLPASYCGVLGIRPSHGLLSLDGVIPFAPSFDVAGWFARDAGIFHRVGTALLGDSPAMPTPKRLLYASDAFDLVGTRVKNALEGSIAKAADAVGARKDVIVSLEGLDSWYETFRVLQGAEIWSNLGPWVQTMKPKLGPGIQERFELASRINDVDVAAAKAARGKIRKRMNKLLQMDDILCLPTSPRVAPFKHDPVEDLEVLVRQQAMSLLCISGLAGLPQVSLPLATLDGLPMGLSLVGRWGADTQLLTLTKQLMSTNK